MKIKVFFFAFTLVVFFSCNDVAKDKMASNETQLFSKNDTISNFEDADYYVSNGFQVFENYDFAIKAPIELKDMSGQANEKHDFNFGGIANDNSKEKLAFIQIIINPLPSSYKDLNNKKRMDFEKDLINTNFPGEKNEIDFLEQKAYVWNYSFNGYGAKSIIFIRNGRIYGFNLMTNNSLSENFDLLVNSIKFLK